MGKGKLIISWLKKRLLGKRGRSKKERKMCYEVTSSVEKNSKMMGKGEFCAVQEQNRKKKKWWKRKKKGTNDKVKYEEQPCTLKENNAQKIENACTLQDRNDHEQNVMKEKMGSDVVDKEQTCISHEITQNMDAHLLKICEQCLEKRRKAVEVKDKLLADPLIYGSSLLSELPSTSDVEIRPPSRAGVGFSISSGTYRPKSRNAWSGKVHRSRLSPIEEEDEEAVAIEEHQRSELARKLQSKMEKVTQNRTARLLGICEQNRDRDRKREEVRSRKKMLHFKPPADESTSLLGSLPPITYVEANPPSEESLGLSIELCSNQFQSWKETLEKMSERSVTEASEEAGQSVALTGQWVKNASGGWKKKVNAAIANKAEKRLEITCGDKFSTSLCCPSGGEALDKDPPGHRCGGVSAKGDEDPFKADTNPESGADGNLKNVVRGNDEKMDHTNRCSNRYLDFTASSMQQRGFEDFMAKYGDNTTRGGIAFGGRVSGGRKCTSGGVHSDPGLDGKPLQKSCDNDAIDFDKDTGYNSGHNGFLDSSAQCSEQNSVDWVANCNACGSGDDEVSDCSSGDKAPSVKDEDWDFEDDGMENWDEENDVPEFDFCIYCPMHNAGARSEEVYCPLHSKSSKAKAEKSGSGCSGENAKSSKDTSVMAKPKGLAGNIKEQKLPDKWVDTRIFPIMTNEELMYEREDLDLFYRRKYFIYIKDRMRSLSYNLELDGIVKNTEEHRRLKRMILKAEEEETMLQWKEATMIREKEKQLKKMLDKVELERRWSEMNKGNVELWKQEQKRNEKIWREKWLKEEKRWQELEAQCEVIEKQLEEEKMAKKEMHIPYYQLMTTTGTRPPSSSIVPDDGNYPSSCTGSSATVEGSRNSFRRRLYRKASRVSETSRVSAEISASAKEYLKTSPILPPIKSAPKQVLNSGGFNEAVKRTGIFLPPLTKLPITCQPQNSSRPQPPMERPKYSNPRSGFYSHKRMQGQ